MGVRCAALSEVYAEPVRGRNPGSVKNEEGLEVFDPAESGGQYPEFSREADPGSCFIGDPGGRCIGDPGGRFIGDPGGRFIGDPGGRRDWPAWLARGF